MIFFLLFFLFRVSEKTSRVHNNSAMWGMGGLWIDSCQNSEKKQQRKNCQVGASWPGIFLGEVKLSCQSCTAWEDGVLSPLPDLQRPFLTSGGLCRTSWSWSDCCSWTWAHCCIVAGVSDHVEEVTSAALPLRRANGRFPTLGKRLTCKRKQTQSCNLPAFQISSLQN